MTTWCDLRPSLTDYLHRRLLAFHEGFRHNLALLGPSGSGKSELLRHVLETSGASATIIACNLERDSPREFLRRFTRSILSSVLCAPAETPLAQLLEQVQATYPMTAAAIQQLDRYASRHSPVEAFIQALDVVPVVQRELRRPCVLLLDEFLYLEELGLSHTFHELGKRVMIWPNVLFWLTSSSVCRAQTILRERLHLLFGQFEILNMGLVDGAAATPWIHQLAPAVARQPDVVQFLLHWLGTSPWSLSVLLKRMGELAILESPKKPAEALLAQAAWDVLGSPDGVLHQWCLAQTQRILERPHGSLAREALVAIARGARTTQAITKHCGSRRSLSAALQLLVEQDVVQRRGACWIIPDQLLACWLIAKFDLGSPTSAKAERIARQTFDHTLAAIWAQWRERTGRPLTERITQLFSQFRNETVSLDQKTGRLPQFRELTTLNPTGNGEAYILANDHQRRWCCLVHEGKLEESSIAAFEQFCRQQLPKPSRKVVVAPHGLELNAKLLAKEANMWVWEPHDLNVLLLLYGQPGQPPATRL